MQQRYYDPMAGRLLSVDPVTTNAKDGSFFGRYHYANNNPYKFKDLDGRSPLYDIPHDISTNASGGVTLSDVAGGGVAQINAAMEHAGAGMGLSAAAGGVTRVAGPVRGAQTMGDIKLATGGQLKGVNQHAVKEAIMGPGAKVSTHNISVDGKGNVVLTPVKKGGEIIESNYKLKELSAEFPKK